MSQSGVVGRSGLTKRSGGSRSGIVAKASGAAPFNPLSLSPTVWLKADLGTGQTVDGTAVSTWSDQSGNANDATQATGVYQPVYKAAVQNSLAVVRFNHAVNAQIMALPSLAGLTTAGTGFIVVSIATDTTSGCWWELGAAGFTFTPFSDGIIYDDFGSTVRKTTVDPATTLAQFNVYDVVSAAGAWTSWLNGTQVFTTATNTVGFNATPFVGGAAVGGNTLTGDIGEILIYPTALSTANRQAVEAYLKTRWATP